MSYRERFVGEEAATAYDASEYSDRSYGTLLWSIEAAQLDTLLEDVPREVHYLDFACGTGRVLSHVARHVTHATGIEISPAMADVARSRAPGVQVLVRDITAPGAEIEGRYDIITAFRFFLNAEPALRLEAMCALRRRLAGPDSLLILNNHGNLFSHKIVTAFPRLFERHRTHRPAGNVLTGRELRRIALEGGLEIHRAAGAGLLGGRLAQRLPSRLVDRVENRFARSRLSRFGSNQIYVARATV